MKYAFITVTLLLVFLMITECNGKQSVEDDVEAKINEESITKSDLDFYELINLMQIEMFRAADQVKYQGEELNLAMKYWDDRSVEAKNQNTLLTQIIRLRAMALLAQEKGHQATPEELDKE